MPLGYKEAAREFATPNLWKSHSYTKRDRASELRDIATLRPVNNSTDISTIVRMETTFRFGVRKPLFLVSIHASSIKLIHRYDYTYRIQSAAPSKLCPIAGINTRSVLRLSFHLVPINPTLYFTRTYHG